MHFINNIKKITNIKHNKIIITHFKTKIKLQNNHYNILIIKHNYKIIIKQSYQQITIITFEIKNVITIS